MISTQDRGYSTGMHDPLADQTFVHGVAVGAFLLCALLLLASPRRWAPVAIIALAVFVPTGQRVVILGLDFTFHRLLVLVGLLRIVIRNEASSTRLNRLDKAVVAWGVVGTLAYTALWGTVGSFIFKAGITFDTVGLYFLFRVLIRNASDVFATLRGFLCLAAPVAVAFAVERTTGRNFFSTFGGVPEFTAVRMGKLRCQGAFSHPILAGCFWASFLPLFFCTIRQSPVASATATVCGLFIVLASASSTPLFGVAVGFVGWSCYRFRAYSPAALKVTVASLVVLHFSMKAPVWHLLSRVDLVGGSTGYHRYLLVDKFIRNFSEWALVGTHSTRHWGATMFDLTNQYVVEGTRGGILTLMSFLGMLALAFSGTWFLVRKAKTPSASMLAWGLLVCLLSHAAMMLAVSYFGQMWLTLVLITAIISSLGETERRSPSSTQHAVRPIKARVRRLWHESVVDQSLAT